MKKILTPLLLFIMTIVAAFCFCACAPKVINGKSAYELYLDSYASENGTVEGALSYDEWRLSLKGDRGEQGLTGADGLSAYEIYKKYTTDNPVLTETEWLESLKGDHGLSSYELYKKNTEDDPVLSETEWLESLKGDHGLSAYELYKKYTTDDPVLSETDWLESLKGLTGDNGLSAYELYKKYTKDDPVLSETEWLESLNGKAGTDGVGIESVDVVCGSIIITYTNKTVHTVEDALPDAGHTFDEEKITTKPTCLTAGVKTYTCSKCGATKKEILDAEQENHLYGEYSCDDTCHWQICRLCGDVLRQDHDFGEAQKTDDANKILECVCGVQTTVGELYAYKIEFECAPGVSVLVYDTQDYSLKGTQTQIAYSRSKTGELLKDGSGQVNFKVVLEVGYKLKSVEAAPATGYNNIKGSEETGEENIYRITKISSDITVNIETEIDTLNLPVFVINTENSAPILDKENYVNCSVSLLNAESQYNFDQVDAGIRLRGNTTMSFPKKPYRIKFKDKQDILGFGKFKSWVLLALYQDFSAIKDYAAFNFARSIRQNESVFVPQSRHVEVYLNGKYEGLYLLTEQVQEDTGRVGVETEFDETLTEVPFLVEWDTNTEGEENVDWFKIVNPDIPDDPVSHISYFNIKYPEADQRYTPEQFNYIKNYIETVYELIHREGVTQTDFEEYVDLPTFIDYYLVQEFMGQVEINWKSIFMSKTTEGKLVMGPVWDFDWAASGPVSVNPKQNITDWRSNNNWFTYMMKNDWFKQAVTARWNEIKPTLSQELNNLKTFKSSISDAAERNALLWDFIDDGNPENDFDGYYDYVIYFLEQRLIWIDGQLNAQ